MVYEKTTERTCMYIVYVSMAVATSSLLSSTHFPQKPQPANIMDDDGRERQQRMFEFFFLFVCCLHRSVSLMPGNISACVIRAHHRHHTSQRTNEKNRINAFCRSSSFVASAAVGLFGMVTSFHLSVSFWEFNGNVTPFALLIFSLFLIFL